MDIYEILKNSNDITKSLKEILESFKLKNTRNEILSNNKNYNDFYKSLEIIYVTKKKIDLYLFLQIFNIYIIFKKDTNDNLKKIIYSENFFLNIEKHLVKENYKFLKIILVLLHNSLKNLFLTKKEKLDFLIDSELIFISINYYFEIYNNIIVEEDTLTEWIYYVLYLLNTNTALKFSVFKYFYKKLDSKRRDILSSFYLLNIDRQIKSKSAYSLILDMRADLLEKDPDFSQRLNKNENISKFYIKKSDVEFLINSFNTLTENYEKNINEIHFFIKILLAITFVGRYNKNLQDLVLGRENNFYTLGKLSELIVYYTKQKIEKKPIGEIPELSTNIIRLASNLIHANSDSQNFLLDNDYLLYYLSHTHRDEFNMYCKEITVVFVRYITESNERARAYIKNLKVEDFIHQNAEFIKKFDDDLC